MSGETRYAFLILVFVHGPSSLKLLDVLRDMAERNPGK